MGAVSEVMGRLFGTNTAVNNLLDKDKGLLVRAGSWVGGLKHTEEEKAEDDQQTRNWGLRQLEALGQFKIVQRIIAFSTLFMWLFVGMNLVVAIWIRALWPHIDAVTALWEFAKSDYILYPVLSVLSLYVSGGVLPKLFGNKS